MSEAKARRTAKTGNRAGAERKRGEGEADGEKPETRLEPSGSEAKARRTDDRPD